MSTYINSGSVAARELYATPEEPAHTWERFTHDRMKWLYGPFYTVERRPQTQADLAAWNSLGKRVAA